MFESERNVQIKACTRRMASWKYVNIDEGHEYLNCGHDHMLKAFAEGNCACTKKIHQNG